MRNLSFGILIALFALGFFGAAFIDFLSRKIRQYKYRRRNNLRG